jgi:hypothetical protein
MEKFFPNTYLPEFSNTVEHKQSKHAENLSKIKGF